MKIYKYYPKNIKGFTLMELLITIAIIGILSAISLFAISDSRKSARDGRRKADLESIRSALELYKADCGQYIPTASFPTVGSALVSIASPTGTCPTANIVYLQRVPGDPVGGGRYPYVRNAANTSRYALCARLEEPPVTEMDVSACGGGDICSGAACNYIVTNP